MTAFGRIGRKALRSFLHGPRPDGGPETAGSADPASETTLEIHVDTNVRPDQDSLFIMGWMWDPEATVEQVRLLVDGADSNDVQLAPYRRVDVLEVYGGDPDARLGFAGFVEFEHPVSHSTPLHLEARLSDGRSRRVEIPPPSGSCAFTSRAELVAAMQSLCGSDETRDALQAALCRALTRCAAERRVAADWTIGEPPAHPELSIIVPLYGGLDLLESQLTEFALDAELQARAELIYVMDLPEQAEALQRLSHHLGQLYRVPCRFLALAHNAGFGGATNEGVRHARGELVMLLNSDVLPAQPGWIGRMIEAWRKRPNAGALSPKLLYEDGSLQDAGLYWRRGYVRLPGDPTRPTDVELWHNDLYFKGYTGSLPEANVAREVPAVSAACLLTSRSIYDDLGGLDETYVHGDCEDSDLCLRIAARGLEIWYDPAVELFHLEAQSYPGDTRHQVSVFNVWQQDRRWRTAMTERMAAFPSDGPDDFS